MKIDLDSLELEKMDKNQRKDAIVNYFIDIKNNHRIYDDKFFIEMIVASLEKLYSRKIDILTKMIHLKNKELIRMNLDMLKYEESCLDMINDCSQKD